MTRISARKTPTFRLWPEANRESGFTLIEILVVIGLIALVMSIAVPNAGMALKINLSNSTRELATVIRSAHDEALLKGGVYRVAFDIENNNYWVESGERDFLMRSAEQEAEEKRRDERRSPEDREKHKDPFSLAKSVTKKKVKLPMGVKFTDVLTARAKDPAKTGVVYAHIFPHGFVEKIVVHLKDGFDRESTLIVSSVTGKSQLFERYVQEPN